MTDLRPLGSPDLLVSAVGLGCNNFGRPGFVTETLPATKAVLDAAIDHGVTFLDTAAMYGSPAGTSESLMGEALRGRRDVQSHNPDALQAWVRSAAPGENPGGSTLGNLFG